MGTVKNHFYDAASGRAGELNPEALTDLYNALEAMCRRFSPFPREDTEGWREEHEACEDARAALAKARGDAA